MTKAILIILTLAGFTSGAEMEVTDRLSVDGASLFKSTAVFSGSVTVGGGIKIGNDAADCTIEKTGVIRYVSGHFYGCDGTNWRILDVQAASVASITPNNGPVSGGTVITITGSNFVSGATVTIGTIPATGVAFVSASSLTATVPARSTTGSVDVTVTSPDTGIGAKPGGFTYNPLPAVTSASPDNGPISGGTVITITGGNFVSGATVIIGTVTTTGVAFVSASALTAAIPPRGTAGSVNIAVTNPDGGTGIKSGGFTYNPLPVVDSVSPASGPSGTAITINGSNFISGATVKVGTITATGVTFVSASMLTTAVPARMITGSVDITVTNPDSGIGVKSGGFAYLFACGSNVVDGNGKSYGTVQVGTQCWMASNLDYDNGCSARGWTNNVDTGWCGYYSGGPYTNEGLLYQWSVVMNGSPTEGAQGLCQPGWHVPSHSDWTTLERAVCTSGNCAANFPYDTSTTGERGTDEGAKLKSGGSSGFNALLAGIRDNDGGLKARGTSGYIWSSTPGGSSAWWRSLNSSVSTINRRTTDNASYAVSLRCLKN